MQLLLQSQGVFGFGMLWLTSSNHMTPMKYVLSTVLDYIYIYILFVISYLQWPTQVMDFMDFTFASHCLRYNGAEHMTVGHGMP